MGDGLEETSTASMGLSDVNHTLILDPDEISMMESTYPKWNLGLIYYDGNKPPKVFSLVESKGVSFIFIQGPRNPMTHDTVNRAHLINTP